jgi:DNA-binding winged helix-turn-helix (wHTH) protein
VRHLVNFRFSDFELDTERMELRRGGAVVQVEPQVFDLIAFLVANQTRVVSRDEIFDSVWQGRIVSLSTLTSRINAARSALGDTGDRQQAMIKTVARRGYRFVGEAVAQETPAELPATHTCTRRACPLPGRTSASASRLTRSALPTPPSDKGDALVKAGNWLNHLEHDWDGPVWSHLLKWFASRWQLTRYDARGNGLSDWDVGEISFDAFVRDLEAVVGCGGAGAVLAVRRLAGLRRQHRLCRQASGAGEEARALWRLRPGAASARLARGSGTERRHAHPDARRLGPGEPHVPAALHLQLRARRQRRADRLVQQPATHHHLARQCRAHPGRVRHAGCDRPCSTR